MTDPMEGWLDKTTGDAMAGDRAAALKLWRQVAEGIASEDTRAWVQHVAAQLLEADKAKKQRPTEILAAVGLAGKLETSRTLRDVIEQFCIVDDFEDLDRKEPPSRKEARELSKAAQRNLIRAVRAAKVLPAHLDDTEILKRIEYVRRR